MLVLLEEAEPGKMPMRADDKSAVRMNNRDIQLRECAYYLWEAEGRPQERCEIHWQMAEIAITLFSYLKAANTASETAGKRASEQSDQIGEKFSD
jgi:hypothetical protein